MELKDTGKIGGGTLRERTSNLANRFDILVSGLSSTMLRVDAAVFGSRPSAEDNAKGPAIDSIEADIQRLETIGNRLENILNDAQQFEGRLVQTATAERPSSERRYA